MVGFIIGILLGFCGYGWKSLPHHNCQPTVRDVSGCSHASVATYDLYHDGRACSAFQRGTQKLVKRFPDRQITVGMDTALIVGHPSVIAPALLLIPVIVILAVILPGNRVMPLGDLSQFVFSLPAWCLFSMATLFALGDLDHFVRWWSVYCIVDGTGYQRSLPEVWYKPGCQRDVLFA